MLTYSLNCPDCGKPVDYWRVHCRCGCFIGFPNRRQAEAERGDLTTRYDAARGDATARRVLSLQAKLEDLAERSLPVINMSFAACDDILRSGKYRNYNQRVESGEREPASVVNHGDREMVGERLFPRYQQHIQYAALSPDGRGLERSYGPVAVRWQVTPEYLARRISLLEQNSYILFTEHSLGRLGFTLPPGHQAIWEDRTKLAASKLTPHLNPATGEDDLPRLLLNEGATRYADEMVEVAIYADEGLDTQDVDMVTIQRSPATPEEAHRREIVRAICANRPIVLVE